MRKIVNLKNKVNEVINRKLSGNTVGTVIMILIVVILLVVIYNTVNGNIGNMFTKINAHIQTLINGSTNAVA